MGLLRPAQQNGALPASDAQGEAGAIVAGSNQVGGSGRSTLRRLDQGVEGLEEQSSKLLLGNGKAEAAGRLPVLDPLDLFHSHAPRAAGAEHRRGWSLLSHVGGADSDRAADSGSTSDDLDGLDPNDGSGQSAPDIPALDIISNCISGEGTRHRKTSDRSPAFPCIEEESRSPSSPTDRQLDFDTENSTNSNGCRDLKNSSTSDKDKVETSLVPAIVAGEAKHYKPIDSKSLLIVENEIQMIYTSSRGSHYGLSLYTTEAKQLEAGLMQNQKAGNTSRNLDESGLPVPSARSLIPLPPRKNETFELETPSAVLPKIEEAKCTPAASAGNAPEKPHTGPATPSLTGPKLRRPSMAGKPGKNAAGAENDQPSGGSLDRRNDIHLLEHRTAPDSTLDDGEVAEKSKSGDGGSDGG